MEAYCVSRVDESERAAFGGASFEQRLFERSYTARLLVLE